MVTLTIQWYKWYDKYQIELIKGTDKIKQTKWWNKQEILNDSIGIGFGSSRATAAVAVSVKNLQRTYPPPYVSPKCQNLDGVWLFIIDSKLDSNL